MFSVWIEFSSFATVARKCVSTPDLRQDSFTSQTVVTS